MLDAPLSPVEDPPPPRYRRPRVLPGGGPALCPVCRGCGIRPTGWDPDLECPGCLGSGMVPAVRLPAMSLAPCDGCGGDGAGAPGEPCPLCAGLGTLVRDLPFDLGEEGAAA
jgi:hypothetical protein